MTRIDFFRKLIKYLLLLLLGLIVVVLGRKVVPADGCSGCPGKGVCNGKSDCSKY